MNTNHRIRTVSTNSNSTSFEKSKCGQGARTAYILDEERIEKRPKKWKLRAKCQKSAEIEQMESCALFQSSTDDLVSFLPAL